MKRQAERQDTHDQEATKNGVFGEKVNRGDVPFWRKSAFDSGSVTSLPKNEGGGKEKQRGLKNIGLDTSTDGNPTRNLPGSGAKGIPTGSRGGRV